MKTVTFIVCISLLVIWKLRPEQPEISIIEKPDRSSITQQPPERPSVADSKRGSQSASSTDSISEPTPETPWVALIIDDFGSYGSYEVLQGFLDLPADVTLSIIPGYPRSVAIGAEAVKAGVETFIHLPMEPTQSIAMNERDMLYVGATSEEIGVIFDRVLQEQPFAVGLNNHMGSKATLDRKLMLLLAGELEKRGLIFIDSWTVPHSLARSVMLSKGVPAMSRDIFLDNDRNLKDIRRQFRKLVKISRKRGWAIGIGHARKEMLTILQQDLTKWTGDGVRFVSVSVLAQAVVKSPNFTKEKNSTDITDLSGNIQ